VGDTAPVRRATPGSPAPDLRSLAAALGVLLFLTYAYFLAAPSWNENSRFALTRSLVERHRVDIDPYQYETGDRSSWQGHAYSDKAPGASLLAVPAYAAYHLLLRARHQPLPASAPAAGEGTRTERILVNAPFRRALYLCNLTTNALAGAFLGGLFFLALCRLGAAPRLAFSATLALAVGSLIFPYATMFYGHVLAAAFLFGAFHLLGPGAGPRQLVAGGVLAGLAVLTEFPTAPAALLLIGYGVWCRRQWRTLPWIAAGAAGPLLLLVAYQLAAFGSVWRTGYAVVSRPEFAEGMSHGLLGIGLPRPSVLAALLFGRARGLLYTAPVLLLGFVGLARRLTGAPPGQRAQPRIAAGIVLYFLLLGAGYYMWWGGSAFGPRHVIPCLPFLCLGIPFAVSRARAVVLTVLLAPSIVNQLAATAVEPSAPLVRDILADYLYPHLLRGDVPLFPGASNFGAAFHLHGPASLLPLLALWAVALFILFPLLPPTPPPGKIAGSERLGDHPAESAGT
jgi:hypothetical protein